MVRKILATSLLIIFTAGISFAQLPPKKIKKISTPLLTKDQQELRSEIFKQDSIFFNAFNNCDSITYRKYLTENFEFYHDQGGLHFLDEEMQSFKEACARNSHLRRVLFKKTLEVYKMGNFGALEIGVHRFYHTNKGEAEHISGDYKFVQVWQKKDGSWKLARVISYDHDKMNNN